MKTNQPKRDYSSPLLIVLLGTTTIWSGIVVSFVLGPRSDYAAASIFSGFAMYAVAYGMSMWIDRQPRR